MVGGSKYPSPPPNWGYPPKLGVSGDPQTGGRRPPIGDPPNWGADHPPMGGGRRPSQGDGGQYGGRRRRRRRHLCRQSLAGMVGRPPHPPQQGGEPLLRRCPPPQTLGLGAPNLGLLSPDCMIVSRLRMRQSCTVRAPEVTITRIL